MKTINKKHKFVPTSTITPANPFVQGMQVASNFTFTENGALTNKSTLNHVLDWFGAGGAIRARSDADVISLFSKAFAQDKLAALKILFNFRDVRGGQGERKTVRTCLNWLAKNYTEIMGKNLSNIPLYGRWDDLYALFGTPLEAKVIELFKAQLVEDAANMKKNKSVSLLAKWLKSENASSSDTIALAKKTREAFGMSSKKYRKVLSALRKHIDVVEKKMCAGEWKNIDFNKVPSKAALNYRKAFGRHEKDRYAEYLGDVEKGVAKINASAIYPYDILRSIATKSETEQDIKAADLQWKAMPNWLEGNEHYGLVISDVSGSMGGWDNGLPMWVSVSLGIYFAERNVGPFKDCWMNFSSSPSFQKLVGNTLLEKYNNMDKGNWSQSTNLQSAFNLILSTAIANRVKQSDMPEVLYIVSDMEFDDACQGASISNFDAMKIKFMAAGYKLPKVVWWNVAAHNDNFPIRANETGTALVSGCSPSILKSLLSAKDFDPMSIVYEVINNTRYDAVVI